MDKAKNPLIHANEMAVEAEDAYAAGRFQECIQLHYKASDLFNIASTRVQDPGSIDAMLLLAETHAHRAAMLTSLHRRPDVSGVRRSAASTRSSAPDADVAHPHQLLPAYSGAAPLPMLYLPVRCSGTTRRRVRDARHGDAVQRDQSHGRAPLAAPSGGDAGGDVLFAAPELERGMDDLVGGMHALMQRMLVPLVGAGTGAGAGASSPPVLPRTAAHLRKAASPLLGSFLVVPKDAQPPAMALGAAHGDGAAATTGAAPSAVVAGDAANSTAAVEASLWKQKCEALEAERTRTLQRVAKYIKAVEKLCADGKDKLARHRDVVERVRAHIIKDEAAAAAARGGDAVEEAVVGDGDAVATAAVAAEDSAAPVHDATANEAAEEEPMGLSRMQASILVSEAQQQVRMESLERTVNALQRKLRHETHARAKEAKQLEKLRTRWEQLRATAKRKRMGSVAVPSAPKNVAAPARRRSTFPIPEEEEEEGE